ncbi:MAG: hypothetical protein E7E98_08165 [Cutibacterium avidum]|nr:hypothetical protein [Cutibacterium avidum]
MMRSAQLGFIAWRDADHQAAAGEDLRHVDDVVEFMRAGRSL